MRFNTYIKDVNIEFSYYQFDKVKIVMGKEIVYDNYYDRQKNIFNHHLLLALYEIENLLKRKAYADA